MIKYFRLVIKKQEFIKQFKFVAVVFGLVWMIYVTLMIPPFSSLKSAILPVEILHAANFNFNKNSNSLSGAKDHYLDTSVGHQVQFSSTIEYSRDDGQYSKISAKFFDSVIQWCGLGSGFATTSAAVFVYNNVIGIRTKCSRVEH